MKYDFLIVGAGLYGSVCAYELNKKGYKVLVIEKRKHIGGNVYTESHNGIQVHKYGAHIFHTNDKDIWDYVNSFAEFNRFTNSPIAIHDGKVYNLPFNMNTFYQLWGCKTPIEANEIINNQRAEFKGKEPSNLEEQAISLVGRDIYDKLIKGYTEKQWGRKATELPAFIIKRLPVRMTYDNNYFSDRFQGIPIGGYTKIINNMLENIDVKTEVDFLSDKDSFVNQADKIIFTGAIDEYFNYELGYLEYRSLRFETESLDTDNFQGNAVVNYTNKDVPFTRIIEHKHFDPVDVPHTIITREYPCEWSLGQDAYYPVNDEKNMELYKKYRALAKNEDGVFFGGRLAEYKYYDMHQVIRSALNFIKDF
ncbi:UDP-galactopyranose mutase [Pectobacterium aroidearum]|uniref:UDP-galactopyranose mutase n=1 Tax=Pectobacterium aroidearum TaxID=1201031 RepID=A0ABR5ZD46_9GAMM|nr:MULTISPECIES: UDP-galactopyranose mutase [Pectobacterium]KHS98737.1 UDP-galactopyranose mutase [Pectobacterium brasiliense]MBA5199700.1 UDP-galactopyranose mutase [Pectobacterium aroidearum]MBA5228308.1 UDP-galactopyranose mutase [Pectobacterium aroidearum]MBA5232492.1 UDP-galactopyranose mutase [Pectobacterium aroidearum]MBA5737832.1 UDP-galactopyranose mutase [Pectobacterium aroidearum]